MSRKRPQPPPAFQLYARDWLTDEQCSLMDHYAFGVHMRLVCMCWLAGSIPADRKQLASLLRTPYNHLRPHFKSFLTGFVPRGSRLVYPKLDPQRTEIAKFLRKQSKNGAKGARARWHGGAMAPLSGQNGGATLSPMAIDGSSPALALSPAPARRAVKNSAGNPRDSYRVILRLAHETLQSLETIRDTRSGQLHICSNLPNGECSVCHRKECAYQIEEGELAEMIKERCAKLHIAYDSGVVRGAVRSANSARVNGSAGPG